jgi:hypothetical protein
LCLWLRDGQGQKLPGPVTTEKLSTQSKEGKAVVCRECGYPITVAEAVIPIDGSQTHTFFNPTGIVFEIICVFRAPGCAVFGAASTEFSWFPGFTWRGALCGNCSTHLGWYFESGDFSFFGLILKKLSGDL